MNNLINLAKHISTPEATLTVAYTPIRLSMPGRQPLELRLTAPATGSDLPILLLSHGYGPSNYIPSKDGYAPLVQFWAERGFSVIQPTHASSRVGGLPSDSPGAPFFWRERVEEIKAKRYIIPPMSRRRPVSRPIPSACRKNIPARTFSDRRDDAGSTRQVAGRSVEKANRLSIGRVKSMLIFRASQQDFGTMGRPRLLPDRSFPGYAYFPNISRTVQSPLLTARYQPSREQVAARTRKFGANVSAKRRGR
ncbi:hypothetical protein [Agrobacterium tumefaciens]|uniref:hypothetical protein n=1 Tax=Agrobacterium tumefaciens TaxID=358 RepID=UPI000EF31ED7|nr:hypothetical protein [Agrobacterium tumefaciens]AYM09273.1 hypothetical protein At1D1460_50320 [Agrobacterium tumefaciens]